MSPRSWHTLVPLKTKGRIECLELEKWNMRQMSAKVQRIIELLGFLRLRNTILACAFHYWSCFSLISKNFKNHLSKNLRFFRADLAFFNTYFYGVRITLLSSTFFVQLWTFFKGLENIYMETTYLRWVDFCCWTLKRCWDHWAELEDYFAHWNYY